MSWVERIQTQIIVQTGDGRQYRPQFLNASYIQDYNVATFEFADIDGTLVRKRRPKGRKFNIEIYFNGDDHLDVQETFRISCNDQRPWTIRHPMYDEIVVQPQSLNFDNSRYNETKITGTVIETIIGIFPVAGENGIDLVFGAKTLTDTTGADNYEASVDNLQAAEVAEIQADIDRYEASTLDRITDTLQASQFRNAIRNAQNAVANAISDAGAAIRAVQEVINFPFQILADVESRLDLLRSQFEDTVAVLGNLTGLSPNQKVYLETNGAAFVSAQCIAAISQLDNFGYDNKPQVDNVINEILEFNAFYIETIDSLITESQEQSTSYAPNPDVIFQLNNTVVTALSRLFEIAFDSRTEFVLTLQDDSNPVIECHRVYGLDQADERLAEFIATNEIGLNELLLLKKGRLLRYYV
jgi:hypothetical protein